jgi:hypothetical protein
MNDDIKDIAPAAIVEPIVSDPVVVAELVATPEAVAAQPKGKPGRPRKVETLAKAPKVKRAPKAKIATDQAAPEAKLVATPKRAKPAARGPIKAPVSKATPAKVKDVVIKTRQTATALLRSAASKQKDIFTMTANTTEMTETIQTAMKDAAAKAKATLEKSQAAMGDMGTFTKGNVEAVVESTKILATGLQEMGKSYVAESKSVVETMTAEIKDLASVKSPTEFFEKQSAMMRKHFDAAMAVSSKNSEAMLKLASEAFQPISNRVSLAVEKIKQAA